LYPAHPDCYHHQCGLRTRTHSSQTHGGGNECTWKHHLDDLQARKRRSRCRAIRSGGARTVAGTGAPEIRDLAARKQLADELHYTGDKNDSATMNIWLHKQVMQKLAENGGKVPDELRK